MAENYLDILVNFHSIRIDMMKSQKKLQELKKNKWKAEKDSIYFSYTEKQENNQSRSEVTNQDVDTEQGRLNTLTDLYNKHCIKLKSLQENQPTNINIYPEIL